MTYRTFKRSCTNWREYATAEKTTVDTGLSREVALAVCQNYNSNLSEEEKLNGTKLEFEEE
jgi:hypothetical protein